jgi:hypothetical protein
MLTAGIFASIMKAAPDILLPKAAVVSYFGGNMAAVGRAFVPTTHREKLSRIAVLRWGQYVPEPRARQLLDVYPDLHNLLLDPISLRQVGPTPKPRAEQKG